MNESLEVPDWPGVWALGDCALIPDQLTGGFHPPTGQHAMREAAVEPAISRQPFIGRRSNPFGSRLSAFLPPLGGARASPEFWASISLE